MENILFTFAVVALVLFALRMVAQHLPTPAPEWDEHDN